MDSKFIIFVTIGLSFCQGLKYESAVEPTAQKEEFTCPEEFGYFPHPSDCSQYYVCVFGGALLESCTGGLMYSHELQTCDWPRNVNQFYCNSSVPLPTNNLDNSASNLNHRVNNNNNNNGGRIRGRISTTTESQYVYKPIKIENYGDLTQVIQSNSNNQQESNNGRNSRSYEQAVPNFKQDNYAKNIPYGSSNHRRRVRRQILMNFLDKIRSTLSFPSNNKRPPDLQENSKIILHSNNPQERYLHGPHPGSMYPPSHYEHVKPTYGAILHPNDLKTTKRPDFHHYLGFSTTTTKTPNYGVQINFHSNPRNKPVHRPINQHNNNLHIHNLPAKNVNSPIKSPVRNAHHNTPSTKPIVLKRPGEGYLPYIKKSPVIISPHKSNKVKESSQIKSNQKVPPQSKPNNQLVTLKDQTTERWIMDSPSTENDDYYYYDNSHEHNKFTTKNTTKKPFTFLNIRNNNQQHGSVSSGGSLKGKYEYESAQPEYGNQRYAAHVPANNSASYVYQQQPNSQPNSQAQTEDENDSSYYVYDDSQQSQFDDDVDYKTYGSNYQQAIPATTTTTTTRRPTTTYAPAPVKQRTRGGSSSSSSSGSSRSSRPTLKPKGSKVKDSAPVRDVYLDAPSRPAPYYETPVSNTPASKCKKDTCVLPDCYCGGKDIPAGLAPEQTPQMVLLTFDDSVNDLNKNLYRDLFEKGRKNPNGCPISATFYVSHEWTDYSQVQNLAADGHEIASHSVSHSFGEAFSQKKWEKEINGQREILAAYGGVKLSDVRGMRAPFLAIGGNNMFKMLHDANFTYDSSMPVYENRPPSWPYTLDYKIFHDCMIPPCPTKSYPGVWEVPMVMWQDLKGGRCSMGDACSNPPTAEGVYQMLAKNFERHYTTNRAPFGLYYHAAWFTQAHHKEGFEAFLDTLVQMDDVWLVTNYQALQWIRNPTPNNRINSFAPFNTCHDNRPDVRPARCNHPRVCNLWHKSGVRYMKTCQTCPQQYPWTGNTGVPFTI